MTYTEDQIDDATEMLNDFVQKHVEYETEHEDAGDNYAHLPREGTFDYDNGEKRLKAFAERHGIKGDLDDIVNAALDNFRMESGHMFSNPENDEDVFQVGAFCVGEIEIDLGYFLETAGIDKALFDSACEQCDAYVSGCKKYAYVSTDCYWFAVITADELRAALGD